jgi:hypothetical protein
VRKWGKAKLVKGHFLKNYPKLAALTLMFVLASAFAAHAGTLTGTVKNGTTNQPAAGVDVILIKLQGGMQPVQQTKTDASGAFSFNDPNLGTAPMLVRVVYRGVNYHEPIPPGKTGANIDVFEPTDKASAFTVPNHAVIIQPHGNDLLVGEEYIISNKTTPPVAFYRADGSFEFNVPPGSTFDQASAWGASGMPVVQSTINKGKDQMAVAFPFRPGESGVRVSYKLPYSGSATLKNVSHYASEKLIIAAPPGVQISGEGIVAAGQDQGMSIYTRDNVPANQPVNISIAGTAAAAPAPAQSSQVPQDPSQDPSINSRADAGAGPAGGAPTDAPTATAIAIPARIDSVKWILVAGFGVLFLLGFGLLMRRPQLASAGAPVGTATPVVSAAAVAKSEAMAGLEAQAKGGLDALKDTLFRLELRRQAGTISDEDYARERGRVESVLRDLVKG